MPASPSGSRCITTPNHFGVEAVEQMPAALEGTREKKKSSEAKDIMMHHLSVASLTQWRFFQRWFHNPSYVHINHQIRLQPKMLWNSSFLIFFETKFFLKPSRLKGQRSCGTLESRAHSRESQEWDLTVVRTRKPNTVRRPRYSSPLDWNHHKKANNDDENSPSAHKVQALF